MDAAAQARRREHPPAAHGSLTRRDAPCLTLPAARHAEPGASSRSRAHAPWRLPRRSPPPAGSTGPSVRCDVRVHQPWRLLAAGLCLIAAAFWLGGRAGAGGARPGVGRPRPACAAWIALAAAAIAMLVGLVKGTRVAGSADAYGYVSQALLWLKGLPVQTEPLAAVVPWPHAEWSLVAARLPARPRAGHHRADLPARTAARDGGGGRHRWDGRGVLGRAGARRSGRVADVSARPPLRGRRQRGGSRGARGREPGVPLPAGPADERRAGDGVLAPGALGSRRRRAPRGRPRRGGGRADASEPRARSRCW